VTCSAITASKICRIRVSFRSLDLPNLVVTEEFR
jgi:hypothetical protein